jgi:hypothetical protein
LSAAPAFALVAEIFVVWFPTLSVWKVALRGCPGSPVEISRHAPPAA